MTNVQIPKELEDFQDDLMLIFQEFLRVADLLGVSATIAYGTALGAARHQDFIPWDTDCDVAVPVDHLPRLIENFATHARHGVVLLSSLDSEYDHLFPRVSLVGVDPNLLHVDIFPLVGTFESRRLALMHLKLGKLCRFAYLLKKCSPSNRWSHDRKKRLIGSAGKLALTPVPSTLIRFFYTLLSKVKRSDHASTWLSLCGSYGEREIAPPSLYFPTSTAMIRNHRVPAPRDLESYLTLMYGDFRTLPPPHSRLEAIRFFQEEVLTRI